MSGTAAALDRVASVLVLDDDPDLLDLVAMVLEMEHFEVRCAKNGTEGLASVAAAGPPDLVLLDLKMPVMDGWEFARRFRARYGEAAPIVVLTAADDARKRAAEVRPAAWLSKPFDIDVLINTVQRQLRMRSEAG